MELEEGDGGLQGSQAWVGEGGEGGGGEGMGTNKDAVGGVVCVMDLARPKVELKVCLPDFCGEMERGRETVEMARETGLCDAVLLAGRVCGGRLRSLMPWM